MSKDKKFDSGKYDFINKAKYVIPAWGLIMVLGLFAIALKGLDYGIDFKGGSEIQVQMQKAVPTDEMRNMVAQLGYDKASVQQFGDNNEYLIRTEAIVGKTDKETNELLNSMIAKITEGLRSTFKDNASEIRRVDTVGPQVGDELKRNSILATFYALFMILIYIGFRFDFKYAPGAVICLLHDVIIMVAIYSVFGKEVNVQTLAAILTLIGYSLNDTIVNFDRIRENEKLYRGENFSEIVNRAVNDSLSRTIITSVTTELAVIALYFLTDGVIQQIAFTLGIGIVLGTFSSIYIAAPLVIWMDRIEQKRAQTRLATAKA
jgi:preprotein translocase subunit SecF